MILLADSGSTKTDWCVADGAAEICRIATHGTNPFFQSADEIAREVDGGLLPQLGNRPIEQIRFYGAGCAFPDKIAVIRDVPGRPFHGGGHRSGQRHAGSRPRAVRPQRRHRLYPRNRLELLPVRRNRNYGQRLAARIHPRRRRQRGRSRPDAGRRLPEKPAPDRTQREISLAFRLDAGRYSRTDLQKTVPEPFSRRPVAVSRGKPRRTGNPDAGQKRFASFLRRNVLQYPDCRELPVHFTGSVAYYYKEILEETAVESGLRIGSIVRTPMEGLVRYHANHNDNI